MGRTAQFVDDFRANVGGPVGVVYGAELLCVTGSRASAASGLRRALRVPEFPRVRTRSRPPDHEFRAPTAVYSKSTNGRGQPGRPRCRSSRHSTPPPGRRSATRWPSRTAQRSTRQPAPGRHRNYIDKARLNYYVTNVGSGNTQMVSTHPINTMQRFRRDEATSRPHRFYSLESSDHNREHGHGLRTIP